MGLEIVSMLKVQGLQGHSSWLRGKYKSRYNLQLWTKSAKRKNAREKKEKDEKRNFLKLSVFLFTLIVLNLFATSCLSQDYEVGDGDVLQITVYDNPDLDKVVRVSSQGVIVLPLIQSVEVGGLTVSEVVKKITYLLEKDYLVDPHVSVFVEEFRSKNATILGEVNKPGLYEISGDISFLEMISKAGGFTKTSGNVAVIKRKLKPDQKIPEIVKIDLTDFIERGDTSVDVRVEDGDSIFIKEARLFFVSGEVRTPSAYKWEPGTTIIKAVTLAGGFTPRASSRNVKIIRKINGEEKVLPKAKMDEPVLPDDVVVVPESFF